MKCKNCSAELQKEDLFCMNCGNPVDHSKNNKKTGIIVAVAVAAVVVIAAVALIVYFSMNKNEKPVVNENPSASQQEVVSQSEVASAEQTTFNLISDVETTTVPTTENTTEKKTVPNFDYDDEESGDEFLFDSANTYITKEYLATCTRDEITVILNEIYARHGYIFKNAQLKDYFNSQSWYHGTESSMEKVARSFSKIEQKNVDTIYAYQKSMGWRE